MSQRVVNKIQVIIFHHSKHEKQIEVLLLKTNQKRGEFWQNVTGKLEVGETPLEGASRELFEETGLENKKIIELNYQFSFKREGKELTEEVFLCLLDKKEHIKIDPIEHIDLKWVNSENITEEHYKFPSNYEAFIKAKNYVQENHL